MASAIAWGVPQIYRLPGGEHIWGREFELLPPGGSMATGALHGVIGAEAMPIGDGRCSVAPDARVLFCGIEPTTTDLLVPHQAEIREALISVPPT
jgi:hypothetical protein